MSATAKHIVFDWNGTLLDDIHAMVACTNIMLAAEGREAIHIDHFQQHYNVPFETFYRGMGFNEEEVKKLMTHENTSFHTNYEPMADIAPLREGATDILTYATAEGVQNVILSNHLVDPIRVQLRRLEIEHLFAEVLAYADKSVQFKDMTKGERLKRFMAKQEMNPAHTMIIGDSVEEIHIAKEQGLISIGITGGCVSASRLAAEKPDYLIHSLKDLKPILHKEGFVA